jgi:hypothetical protein
MKLIKKKKYLKLKKIFKYYKANKIKLLSEINYY